MSTPRSFTGEQCDLLRLSEDYGDVGRATLLEDEWKRGKKRRLREVYGFIWKRQDGGWDLLKNVAGYYFMRHCKCRRLVANKTWCGQEMLQRGRCVPDPRLGEALLLPDVLFFSACEGRGGQLSI